MAKIAKIAIDKGELKMFAEAMSHTPESGRKEFAEKIFKTSLKSFDKVQPSKVEDWGTT
ncbi:MAG: hypothetical protein K2X93_08970 [Candidatus Obscuribacterales bacterium]|nr:hypothetical protein [Candidatus Obscuribacterales bacterium]